MKSAMAAILAFFFLVFSSTSLGTWNCTNTSSTISNSDGVNCTVTGSTIINANITGSNVTNSNIRNSRIENMSVFDATVIYNILTSGRIHYEGYIFYPVFNVTLISSELPIRAGQFTYPAYVRNNGTFNVTYEAAGVGYTVNLNMSTIDSRSTSLLELKDDGIDPDRYGSDNILSGSYTINSSNDLNDGQKSIFTTIADNLGNIINASFNIILDNTKPSALIEIIPLGEPGYQGISYEYTSQRLVSIGMTYSDTQLKDCRYSNEDLAYSNWETCTASRTWLLTSSDGSKTVIYQVRDQAGNINTTNDTIILNSTGIGLDTTPPSPPIVLDDGDWTNSLSSITFNWYNSTDIEMARLGLPIQYQYLFNSSSDSEIIGWNSSVGSNTQITISSTLTEGTTYYLGVRAMNMLGNLSNASTSDGIRIDATSPSSVTVTPNITTWTRNPNFQISWTAIDALSGIEGYSYLLSRNQNLTLGNIINNLSSKTFNNVASGKYYFHIKARDRAGNWGIPSGTTNIFVDTNSPTTPQLSNTTILSNGSTINFNWTTSRDITSGIANYTVNITKLSNGRTVYIANIGNVTGFSGSQNISANTVYYVNVRSVDLAGNPSLWSSQAQAELDTIPPQIMLLKPRGGIITYQPYMAIATSERCECFYTETTGYEFSPYDGSPNSFAFDYTNTTYHETYVSLNTSYTSFNLIIECYDKIRNWNQTTISFSIIDQRPTTVEILEEGSYYSDTITTTTIRVINSTTGLGEIGRENFKIRINNTDIEDYSILDLGDGNYSLKYKVPSISGRHRLLFKVYSATYNKTINVNPMYLNLKYLDSGLIPVNNEYTSHHEGDYYIIGVGATNTTNITSVNNTLSIKTSNLNDDSVIFMTRKGANIKKGDRNLKTKKLFEQVNPSFGYQAEEDLQNIMVNLEYTNYNITGIDKIYPGYFELKVTNLGLTNTKTRVDIQYKDEEDTSTNVIQWS